MRLRGRRTGRTRGRRGAAACVLVASFLAAALLPGCVRHRPDDAALTRNGVRYGVTGGLFRGRWWNYYERGRSYADGGFWEEAARDLRVALAARGTDQLWARTYGLHFLPEYFPNRELGVVLYHTGDLDGAVGLLETSLDQKPSARASFFLTRARRAQVTKSGADARAPEVAMLSPQPGEALGSREVAVRAVVRDDTYVSSVRVNGEPVDVPRPAPEVLVETTVMLGPGQGHIHVEASDLLGRTGSETIALGVDLDGPAVSFDRPIGFPGTVRGVVADPAGVAGLTIAGTPVTLAEAGPETRTFEHPLMADLMRAHPRGIPYACKDAFGNRTEGLLPVDATVVGHASDAPAFALGAGPGRVVAARDGTLIALGPDRGDAPPSVRFAQLRNGQRFFKEDVLVTLDIEGREQPRAVTLNGVPLALLPGRRVQSVSRTVRLAPGKNTLCARVTDAAGREREAAVTIERHESPLELRTAKLSAALLGALWAGNPPRLAAEQDFIVDELQTTLYGGGRFALVDRESIADVLAEQQLAEALATPDGREALGEVVPAELILAARVRRDLDSIEIVVEGISADTTVTVARADVAGPGDTLENLDALVRGLADRLTQAFPRANGLVRGLGGTRRAEEANAPVRCRVDTSEWSAEPGVTGDAAALMAAEVRGELYATPGVLVMGAGVDEALALERALTGDGPGAGAGASAHVAVRGLLSTPGSGGVAVALDAVDLATSEVLAHATRQSGYRTAEALRLTARLAARDIAAKLAAYEPPPDTLRVPRRLTAEVGARARVRESMKLVVYREGPPVVDPVSNVELGRQIQIVGEALVHRVGEDVSIAEVLTNAPQLGAIQVGDHVVVK